MKASFLGVGIVGILFILFGIVFALQGRGIIGGSSMTGNSFWIYAGSVIAVVGVIFAVLGFSLGSRTRTSSKSNSKEDNQPGDSSGSVRMVFHPPFTENP